MSNNKNPVGRKLKKFTRIIIVIVVLVFIQLIYEFTYPIKIDFTTTSVNYFPGLSLSESNVDFSKINKTAEQAVKQHPEDYCCITITGFANNDLPFFIRKYSFYLAGASDDNDLFVDSSVIFSHEAPNGSVTIFPKCKKEIAVSAVIRKDLLEDITPEILESRYDLRLKGKLFVAFRSWFPEFTMNTPASDVFPLETVSIDAEDFVDSYGYGYDYYYSYEDVGNR